MAQAPATARYEFAPLFAAGKAVEAGAHVISDQALEALRAEARAEGEAAGRRAAETATERRRADALAAIAAGLPQIQTRLEAGLARIETAAAELALDIGRALADEAIAAAPVDALRPTLRAAFERLAGAARLTVTVHESVAEAVGEEIARIAQEAGFGGHVRVVAGAAAPADLHVEWGDGGIERRLAEIAEEIRARFATHGVGPDDAGA